MKTIPNQTSPNNFFDYFILMFLVVFFCWTGLDAVSALVSGKLDEEPYWGESVFLYIDLGLLLTSGVCVLLMLSRLKQTRFFLMSLILLIMLLIAMGVARHVIYHGEAAGYDVDFSPFGAIVMAVYASIIYAKNGTK
jgi:hypothetical protein